MGDNKDNRLLLLTDTCYPRIEVTFGGKDSFRSPMEIDVDSFVGVKSYKAKGKRVTTFEIAAVAELEPARFPEPPQEEEPEDAPDEADLDPDSGKSESDIIDEITGQMKLFE